MLLVGPTTRKEGEYEYVGLHLPRTDGGFRFGIGVNGAEDVGREAGGESKKGARGRGGGGSTEAKC